MYISFSTKTRDRYPGLLQSLVSCFLSSIPCVVTRSPAALTVPVVFPLVTKCKSLPCVIYIIDHMIQDHVLLSATSYEPKSGKRVQCALQGTTTVFNPWIQLTQAHLDNSAPMASQLAKLNEAWVNLHAAGMGVTDIQYCLILLHALPTSYEVLSSTILASGTPATLKHAEITACILNEEGRRSGPSGSSLNAHARAPIKGKGKGKKRDHSGLTCHYCNKKGHIQPDCRKKKKDEADKAKEGKSSSNTKAANAHVKVDTPSTE